MYRVWFAIFLLAGATLFGGCKKAEAPARAPAIEDLLPREAQPKLPTVKLWLGPEVMDAEVAITLKQITTGMMFRKTMGENDGMLFVLPQTQQAKFWMTNCFIPLSVAYIDPEGVIQEIHPLEPHNIKTVDSASDNIRFALETPQGWFQRHNVGVGIAVRTERGSLQETFFQNR